MNEDAELLRRYTEGKSEAAFAELVRRHVGFVYGIALRRVHGDAHLAEEVAQGVFTDLARKAAVLVRHPALGAWLFRSARFAAAQAMRSEKRRKMREQEAQIMHELPDGTAASEPNWSAVRPVLDEVMETLPERDRVAVWLRVCEGRPFAEVGARLSASEDAVRVRVDRALEKMRVSLARRGVVSTTVALTSALAQEAGIVAPAGFAASVTGAALAGAAAGGGIAAGLGLSTFMSTIKLAAWSGAVAVLCASVAGNAYLLTNPALRNAATLANTAAASLPNTSAAAMPLLLVKDANLSVLRDQLRASGVDEAAIRAMLEGVLRRRYREKLSEDRAERTRRGWWRDPRVNMTGPETPVQFGDDRRLLREMVTRPLEQLLGPDPLALAEADVRYAFLPAELRQAFGKLDRDTPPNFVPSGQLEADGEIETELAGQRRAVEEKRKELVDALTPAQRTDWEMRMSPFAANLGRQLERIDATETEYRAVFPIAENLAKARNAKPSDETDPMAARDMAEQQAMQQLVTTLGYERALDYIWGGALEYAHYARVAREANLPASTAGRVMQLAAETANQAAAVHSDAKLGVEQKRAALVALQQSVRPALDALLPPEVQQRLAPNAQTWFTGLGVGTYKPIRGSLPGATGIMVTFPKSVESPPPVSLTRLQLLPQRPPMPQALP